MESSLKHVILLGPQGSGKSTQRKLISEYLKVKIASSGDILRKVISEKTEIGNKVASFVNEGILVPDQLMIDLFTTALSREAYTSGFLLDGFPRNTNQAKDLDKHYSIDRVINIEISDEVAIKRISGRRICTNGHVWHIEFRKPKKEGVCDDCGSELHTRVDDKPELIAKRLFIYRQETSQLLKYYMERQKLVTFDGEQSIDKVGSEIKKYLQKNV